MNSKAFQIHPVAQNFPLLEGKDYEELKSDIAANGLRAPIVKKGNVILDGRNRLRACEELGVEPHFTDYDGEDEVGLIVSMNLHRRHLTDDQRVSIVAKLLGPVLSKEAAARQKAGDLGSKSTQGRVREHIARAAKVTVFKARGALKVARVAPSLADKVIKGEIPLRSARNAVDKRLPRKSRPKAELPLRDRVQKEFLRFMNKFAWTDYRDVRKYVREILETQTNELAKAESR